ncbi:hypothetical protein CSKR_107288 [Clonorchis sinensis]|uniref:Uncharacterized protein n=1 Tax=Clonorchis sinensis TaxID=79923 RepID=A0A419Q2T5_CLOSI|nr:hypothetical protein CSKR_107288 [Clonorchis sinensis]
MYVTKKMQWITSVSWVAVKSDRVPFLQKKSFSCSTLSVPSCHATRRKHEGWDTARLPKPRQGKSRGRGGVRTTDLPRLTWNPAESPVCDVFRQLNVLHQAASCSSCYDIRDIAIHTSAADRLIPSTITCSSGARWLSGYSVNLLTVVRTRHLPVNFPCLGLGNLAVSQPSFFLLVAW